MQLATLRRLGPAIAAMLLLLASLAQAQDRIVISLGDPYPTRHVISTQGAAFWMRRATELSGGRLAFKYFPAEQMAKAGSLLHAVRSRILDSGLIAVAYASDKLPLNGVTMLPGLTRSSRQGSVAYWNSLKAGKLRDEFTAAGVVPMFAFMFPAYQIIHTAGELRTPDAFRGLKLRSAGGSMNLMVQSIGATPISIPTADMYLALERRTIDGTFLSLNAIQSYKLQEVATSASTNGSFGTFSGVYAINAIRFDTLPRDIKEALVKAGEETVEHLSGYLDSEIERVRAALEKTRVKLYEFSPDEQQALETAMSPVALDWVRRLEARHLPASEVLKEFSAAAAMAR